MNNIHLYIGSTEVEFDGIPEILYTYQVDDLTNPTVIKNSFSKTLTISGTKSNNNLFGHYWNVERAQVGGPSNAYSVYFNASKKISFSLYVGTELYEQGYVKLDEVRLIDGNYEYDITLYGGLGDFFYNLSINGDGNEMKLSDLDFKDDIDFTVNIETIKEAWDSLKNNKDNKWQTINFMPAYNGLPEDFDSDKMIIDTKFTNLIKQKSSDGKVYKTKDGYTLATLPNEMTEWETRDLRSYLQRPCIRMKSIIEACCDSKNNGGYEVVLDEDFFNKDNPYWEQTWLSLGMIQGLEYNDGEQTIPDATLLTLTTEGSVEGYMYQEVEFDLGGFKQTNSISIKATIDAKTGFPNTSFTYWWNWNGDSYHTGWWCVGSLFCQLLAFNGETVVGASNVYNLTTPIYHNGKIYAGQNHDYVGGRQYTPYMGKTIYDVLGTFKSGGFTKEGESSPAEITFRINGLTTNVTDVKMCFYWGASKDKIDKCNSAYTLFDRTTDDGWGFLFIPTPEYSSNSYTNPSDVKMTIKSSDLKAVMTGEIIGRTGTEVTKELMLNTEASPCDYLLSYCKMFGLYFSKSLYENKIFIETRKTFYNRSSIVDITKDIDLSKGVTITPIAFDSKWVQFSQEKDETQFSKNYFESKGIDYGCKVLNTGYEFNSEKKDLLDGNVIKSGIEGLERSKYFTCYNNDNKVRPFFGYGMRYNLYNNNDTIEVVGTNASGSNLLGINEGDGLKYYDLFPKLQFHDADNGAVDGNNVLVFFSGFKNLTSGRANPVNYFLTDDGYKQTQLNEGTPCWLFVSTDKDDNGRPIARKVTELPVFERFLTDADGNKVKKSLDFGSSQEMFIPNYSLTDDTNIYHNFWRTYLEDLYDINTKILTVYMRLKGNVGYDLLRQFYWFNNSIWRLNKIVDWNIGVEDVTKVEFVKVQNIADYTSITQTKGNTIKVTPSKYVVSPNGEMITLSLETLNGGSWYVKTSDQTLVLNQIQGNGNSVISLTVPQTKSPVALSKYYITAVDDEGNMANITLQQGYIGETQLSLNPTKLIVPSDGGEYDINFEWINQGNNDVQGASFEGDVTGNVEIDGFSATVFVNESNDTDAIISGKVLFEAGDYDGKVLIDQMPSTLEFSEEGGTYDLVFNYNTNVTYSNLPYWVTVENNKITVLPNIYEVERSAQIVVSNGNSFAHIWLKQSASKGTVVNGPKVSPNNLYYGVDGGSQFVSINIPNTWRITESLDWISTNMVNGDSNAIVQVTATPNNGDARSGIITIQDVVKGENINVCVNQLGTNTEQRMSVSPFSEYLGSDGGIVTITITYTNRNGDYVGVETELDRTDLIWNGEVATFNVNVPKNDTFDTKAYVVYITSSVGTEMVIIYVDAILPILNYNLKLNVSDNGGEYFVDVESNLDYYCEQDGDFAFTIITPSNTQGKKQIKLIIPQNISTNERYAYLRFKTDMLYNGGPIEFMPITIHQDGAEEMLTVTPTEVAFNDYGGSSRIIINSNTEWNITIDD